MCEWYSFNFNIVWPEGESPKTWIDVFITDTIVRDVVRKKKSEIAFWRVHRRRKRDEHGHELSFDCCAEKNTGESIRDTILLNPAYRLLTANELLSAGNVTLQERGQAIDTLTRDEPWPPELQRAWPYFILGVSQMYLDLMQHIKAQIPNFPAADLSNIDIEEIARSYTVLDKELACIWQQFGSHAFLHHLSAAFGYNAIRINDDYMLF